MSVRGSLSLWRPFAVVIAGLAIGGTFLALFGPTGGAVDSWMDFLMNTLFVFSFTSYGYRSLFHRWKFWALFSSLFVAHCVAYSFALKSTGPWRSKTSILVAFIELGVFVLIFTSMFRVAPQSNDDNS